MQKIFVAIALLCALSAGNLQAQTGNSQVTGIVQDATSALIPGVTVTLTNKGTNVTQTGLTNESGSYYFSSVPPGIYKISAELSGFQTSAADNLEVGTNAQVRWNFKLDIGAANTKVDVVIDAGQELTETTPSVGVNLNQQKVTDLPLVGQNILSLLDVLPGFRASALGDNFSTVGGLNLDYINTTINGLSTNSTRDAAYGFFLGNGRQVMTTNTINPDLVGEIRLILSPVDAELGRGNSQIQIQTRSGTNKYAGSVVWDVQNTALNSWGWARNRVPNPTPPDWYNLHQLTGSYGGPIVKNKTFFFALFDKQMVNRRNIVTALVPTDTARNGVFRYWDGWNPALYGTVPANSGTQTATVAAVDLNGNPVAPPSGAAILRCFSIFGNVKVDGTPFTANDCGNVPAGATLQAIIPPSNSPWDQYRTTVDTTGFMKKILGLIPHANCFYFQGCAPTGFGTTTPDGLNTAGYRYLQHFTGSNTGVNGALTGVVNGPADYNNRNQINLKIDHNFNTRHRVSVSWTYERTDGEIVPAWGGDLNGSISRHPQFVTVNGTSTLSPALVNEARFGLNYSTEFQAQSWNNPNHADIVSKSQEFIVYGGANPSNGKKYPIIFNPGNGWNGYWTGSAANDFGNYSPLWDYADTVRWTHGKHSFSAGAEYRRPTTTGYVGSNYVTGSIGNAGTTQTNQFFSSTAVPPNNAALFGNFLQTVRGNAGTLLNTFNGAVNVAGGFVPSLQTGYWIDGQNDIKNGTWQDVTTATNTVGTGDPYGHQNRTQIGNEYSFFIKDDYKVNRRLTLNLGIRYDLNKSPYMANGLTNTFDGGGLSLFGVSRVQGVDPFSTWLRPGSRSQNVYLSNYGSTGLGVAPGGAPLQCVKGAANPNGIPASTCDPNLLANIIFIGPGTDHLDQSLIPEKGQWSPAIGFSWALPWFGDGKTTVRGGFQRTYGQAGSQFSGGLLSGVGVGAGSGTAALNRPEIQAILTGTSGPARALNLSDLSLLVPAPAPRAPATNVFPVYSHGGNVSSGYALYDANYRIPHTDNWTLSIQRSLRNNMTLEIRSTNTLAKDQPGNSGALSSSGTFDLNTVNVFHNPELLNALENTRAGKNDPLFDQMLMGLNLNPNVAGYGPIGLAVNGVVPPGNRGSAQIRRAFQTAMANGDYVNVLNGNGIAPNPTGLLNITNPTGAQTLPIDPSTALPLTNVYQRVLRNGCDRIANGLTASFTDPDTGQQILPRCFPENYMIENPQLFSAPYATNIGYTNYHSLDVAFTMRPTYGLSFQATYSISKTLGLVPGSTNFTDPLNPSLDYGPVLGNNSGGSFRANGTVELPIGPNKLLFPNSSGWMGRLLERWQLGFIYSLDPGSPRTFAAANMLYANGRPNIVGPWENPKADLQWNGANGYVFGDTKYGAFVDPQCNNVTAADGLQAACSLQGLAKVVPADTPGAIPLKPAADGSARFGIPLLVNAAPGTQGNLGNLTMRTLGRWRFDGNISKTFRINDSKSFQLRVDATNIFNHPTPSDPIGLGQFNILQGTGMNVVDNFGLVTGKTGNRTFQAKLRISF